MRAPQREREILRRGALGLGQRARLVAEVAHRGLQVERRDVVRRRRDPGLLQRGRDRARGRACGRRTCGTRGPARRAAGRPPRRGRARRSALLPRGGRRSSPARCGRKTRSAAAWIASSREFVPTSSKVCLSREPWKRSIRTRSATSSSRHAIEAAVAEREEVLGREEAEGRADARARDARRRRTPGPHPRSAAARAPRARRAAPAGRRGAPA